jgi:KDO2-lipid IV(A) lauroyltransferase
MNPQVFMRWGSPIAAAVPRRWAESLADRAGDAVCDRALAARSTVTANLRQVLGTEPDDALVRGSFRTYARYYLAMMRLAHMGTDRAVGCLRLAGVEALEATLARGRGALVLSAHLGNWDLVGVALAQRFGEVCVFVEALRPASLLAFYSRVRARHGLRATPAGVASRLPLEVLGGNGLLALAADRPFGVRRVRVPCGEGHLVLPAGGLRLALRAGAAIHAVFAIREQGGFVVEVGPDLAADLEPLRRSKSEPGARRGTAWTAAHENDGLERVAARYAAALQATVRRYPDQWCLLHPMDPVQKQLGASGLGIGVGESEDGLADCWGAA